MITFNQIFQAYVVVFFIFNNFQAFLVHLHYNEHQLTTIAQLTFQKSSPTLTHKGSIALGVLFESKFLQLLNKFLIYITSISARLYGVSV